MQSWKLAISDEELRSPEFLDSVDEARWKDAARFMRRCRHYDGNGRCPAESARLVRVQCSREQHHPSTQCRRLLFSDRGFLNRTVDSVHSPTEIDGDGQDARIRRDHHCHGLYVPKRKRVFGNNKEFSNVILRMGAFHTRMTFLAVIGKRLGNTGLSDIFIEAGIVAAGSVSA